MSQSSQEKSEQPTARKKQKAKKDGQVARAKDLVSALIMLSAAFFFYFYIEAVWQRMNKIMATSLSFDRTALSDPWTSLNRVGEALFDMVSMLAPLFAMILLATVAGSLLIGGWLFAPSNLLFKFNRISLIEGAKRIISKRSLVELGKSVIKVSIIFYLLYWFLDSNVAELIALQGLPEQAGIIGVLSLLFEGIIIIASALVVFGFIDIPNQIWQHNKSLKMTKQEVKDEMKDTDGKPEVKQRIREIQQRMARKQFNVLIPTADAVITNPTHFAVAIKYDPKIAEAPYVIAKGVDDQALYIKQLASSYRVEVVESPKLARAIYYSSKADQEVAEPLYFALAQVLNYVNKVKAFKAGRRAKPEPLDNIEVPKGMRT